VNPQAVVLDAFSLGQLDAFFAHVSKLKGGIFVGRNRAK
jgi:hypothetical protein